MATMRAAVVVILFLVGVVGVVGAAAEPIPSYHKSMAGQFPVVDGDRQAVIVGQSHFLRRVVAACTGVTLKQVPETRYKPKDGDFPIYVGVTKKAQERLAKEIAQLDIEGYIILVEPTYAIVYAGPRRTDTGEPRSWAEGDFCRRFMGVDHYFPGELGIVFPKQEKVVVPCGLWVENPAFKHRHWSGYSGAAHSATWRLRASGGGGRFKYHHNLYRIIVPKKYKDHPEYFPVIYDDAKNKPRGTIYRHLKPGQRYVPTTRVAAYWQPCTTHPDVLGIVVEAALAAIAKNPENPTFSLAINDSGGFCVCPACVKATPAGVDPYSRAANAHRFFDFYNKVAAQVAQKYPNARLGFLAYSTLGSAYPKENLHPILMPYRTLSFADAWDPAYKKALYETVEKWSGIATHFGIYEYYYGRGFLIPRIYLHQMAEGLRHAHKLGAEGFYAEAYANWGMDGPKLWVTEKLLWNPAQDVDALIEQWCKGLFAEAAPQMRAYFDYAEKAWVTQKPAGKRRGMYRLMGSNYKKEQFTEIFPPAVRDEAWALLGKAEAAATQDVVKKRIAYFKDSFGATRLASSRFNAAARLAALRKAEAAKDNKNRKTPGYQPKPIYEWLLELEHWAAYPDIDSYMNDLRAKAPFAFHEFSQETATNRQKNAKKVHYSFAAWDTDADAIRTIVERTVGQAMDGKPKNKAELDAAVGAILDGALKKAQTAGKSVEHAVNVVRPLCLSMTLDARALPKPPTIDGTIEPGVWGEAQFDGSFYRYAYESRLAEERTKVWCGAHGGKLYVAFYCYQDPKSVRNILSKRDDVELVERRGRKYIDLGRPFPYLTNVDSVGVSLPGYRTAMVTSAGGIFDGQGTAYGPITDWNGCTAKVTRVADGWCVEMALDLGGKSFLTRRPQGTHRLNFFRTGGGGRQALRAAWVPAAPHRWAIDPRASGVVFFGEGK